MEVGAEVLMPRQGLAEGPVHHPRLQGTQADADVPGRPADRVDQRAQTGLLRQVPAPGGDLDARDHDLPVALLTEGNRLRHRLVQRQGPHRPPGVGDDAVGAEVAAPVLHLEHGPGPLPQTAGGQPLEAAALQRLVQALAPLPGAQGLEHLLQKGLASAAAGQNVRPQRTHRRRIDLAVAAAHPHDGLRVLPPAAPDHGPVLLVRHLGHGAGIDDVGVAGLGKIAGLMAHLPQQLLHGLGLVLVDLAAQGVKGKLHVITTKKSETRKTDIISFIYCVIFASAI